MRATQYAVPQTGDQINLLDIPLPGLYDFDTQLETQHLDDYEILRRREVRLVQAIAQASKVIQQVTESSGDLFDVVHYACGPSSLHFRKDSLAFKFIQVLKNLEEWDLESVLPLHQFNPYLELVMKARKLVPDIERCIHEIDTAQMKAAEGIASSLNRLVAHVRDLAGSPVWRKRSYGIYRKHADNYGSLCNYLNAAYEYKCSRNLLIRLDLAYRLDHATVMPRMSEISIQQARSDLARFLRYVRKHFPMTGFARRLEFGLYTGYHFHVLILLNGNLVQNDVALGFLQCEHWVNVITEGQGRAFNCNAKHYLSRGIGMIDYHDLGKRRILLERVAPYLTKVDFWMEFDGGGKSFTRGQMPTVAPLRAGRPRVHHVPVGTFLPGVPL